MARSHRLRHVRRTFTSPSPGSRLPGPGRRRGPRAVLRSVVVQLSIDRLLELGARSSVASYRSFFSVLSHRSVASVGSTSSLACVGSAASAFSAGSILSVGSAGSILSIGSAGSILSVGSAGALLGLGAEGGGPAESATEVDEARAVDRMARGLALGALVSVVTGSLRRAA